MHRTTIDGRYVLLRPLGSGGMAEVFLAHDEILDRDVALKILRGPYANDEEAAERFRREAKSAGGLSHPNIVPVYDRGEDEVDGTSYIAMEYVPGGTLKERIEEKGPLEERRAAAVAYQIASALEEAHERGVIHRDIKPQNVLVTASGDVKVTDFGIARAASAITISRTNAVFGTAAYLSPEQALGKPVDRRSDLYSLGVVLYEMLTGELPFDADNPMAVCMMHVHEEPFPPKELNPGISDGMNALVLKLLAKDPDERPASATELLEDLDRVRSGLPPTAPAAAIATATAATAVNPAGAATATGQTETLPEHKASPNGGEAAATTTRLPARPRRRWVPWVLAGAAVAVLALLGAALLVSSPDGNAPLGRVQDVLSSLIEAPKDANQNQPGGATTQEAPNGAQDAAPPPVADPAPADPSSAPSTASPAPGGTPSTPPSAPPDGGGNPDPGPTPGQYSSEG